MRLLLIIMGAFVAIVCLAKPTEARDYPWCAYYNSQHGGAANCGKMRHLIFQIFTLGSFKKTTVAYREIDGHKILADVYRPQDTTIRPVIVWIHYYNLKKISREEAESQTDRTVISDSDERKGDG